MKRKTDKLIDLFKRDGWYIARTVHHWELKFLNYPKRVVIQILRDKYNCVVPHEFY